MSKIIITALTGSHNTGLNVQGTDKIRESDKDYKHITAPSFEQLYRRELPSQATVTYFEDETSHDIRKFAAMLWKSNPNYLEVLFSVEFNLHPEFEQSVYNEAVEICLLRHEIARMNLPRFYESCIGMYRESLKKVTTGSENTQYLVEQFGYDPKAGMQAYRALDLLDRFYVRGFDDFKDALFYSPNTKEREFMLDLRNGVYTLDDLFRMLDEKKVVAISIAGKYQSIQPNENTKQKLDSLVYELVRKNIREELACGATNLSVQQ